MICYTCHQSHYGGLYAGHKEAVGICQHCGIGVCDEHGQKADEAGAPLLCLGCAHFLASATDQRTPHKMPIASVAYTGLLYGDYENGYHENGNHENGYHKASQAEVHHG